VIVLADAPALAGMVLGLAAFGLLLGACVLIRRVVDRLESGPAEDFELGNLPEPPAKPEGES
jgi:hypothetical protein